jgi:hypothetical protein
MVRTRKANPLILTKGPNQAIQRTRGSGLSGSWSGSVPASVARVR